jgi:magnesium-protoporphyrin O-methyltransferase
MTPLAPAAAPGRPERIRTYFEGRAENWIRLTSDAPVSGVRARVRAGREVMSGTLMGWLPAPGEAAAADPPTVLDAGCGPGEVALRLASLGFSVTGVELAPSLVAAARERVEAAGAGDRITVLEGDATRPEGGPWDHVLAMDMLFHYPEAEAVEALARLAGLARRSVVVTVAPRTPFLGALRALGGLFPRRDRAPSLHPVQVEAFVARVLAHPELSGWTARRSRFVRSGVYFSHALEFVAPFDAPGPRALASDALPLDWRGSDAHGGVP